MKLLSSLIIMFSLLSNLISGQEIIQPDKTKIGKYEYEIYLKDFYSYEIDEYGINYYIRLKGREQAIGSFLLYRTHLKSRDIETMNEKLPPNPLLKFKDREVTGEGNIELDKKSGKITNTFINYTKTNDDEPDSVKRVYKQRKDGFFDLILLIEYKDGKEKVILKR